MEHIKIAHINQLTIVLNMLHWLLNSKLDELDNRHITLYMH